MEEYMDQNINSQFPITRFRVGFFQVGSVLAILFLISRYDYLLFHSLAEFISASIAIGIFMLAWNSRKYFTNNFYLFIGVAFGASGLITFIHTVSYRGMGVIPDTATNANLATQLWLANQYLLAFTFAAAPFFLKRKLNTRVILLGYITLTALFLLAIFDWKIFPVAYWEGTGLSSFKKISDYIITFLFLVAIYFFRKKKEYIHQRSLRLMSIVLVFFAFSTWLFTLYVGVYDFFNMLGHLFQIMAYYASYLAIVELGLMRPYQTMFKELNDNRAALRYEKDKLTNILDNMVDGVYITSDNHEIIYANPALEKDFGKVNNHKCYQYLHDRNSVCPWCQDQEVFKGETKRWEWYYPKVGKTFDLIDSPLVTPDGKMTKMTIYRDITEQKKAREEIQKAKEQWEKTFDSVPDLIAILDNNHQIVRANKAMAKKLNMEYGKCAGLNCYECVHGTNGPIKNCPHSLTILDGQEHIAEVEEPRLGGTFLVSTTPLFDENKKIIGSVHVARDITERKKMEKAKDEFLSLASHQLRTPLANIRLSSELMLRGLTQHSRDDQKNFLEEINKASKRMAILVSNLLNISRIEMGTFDIKAEATDLGSRIRDIAEEFRPLMRDKNINYNIDVETALPVIYFDENILRIILENLLSNSLRYTPKNGSIGLTAKKDDGHLIISVEDTGCGIPEEERDDIFQKSFRTEIAKSITSEGAGLGLYMVKSVCDRIDAEIWFESEIEKGTTFFVSLTLKEDTQLKML